MRAQKPPKNTVKMDTEKVSKKREPRPRCNGLTSQGKRCRNLAVKGSDKCRQRHSGNAAKGEANGNYKAKHWTGMLPEHILDRIWMAWEFTELFTVKEQIVYCASELSQLAEMRGQEGNPMAQWSTMLKLWKPLHDVFLELLPKIEDDNKRGATYAKFSQFTDLMQKCSSDYEIRREIKLMMREHAGYVAQQSNIEHRDRQFVKVEELALLFNTIFQGFEQYLPDENVMIDSGEARRRIASFIAHTFNLQPANENGYRPKRKPRALIDGYSDEPYQPDEIVVTKKKAKSKAEKATDSYDDLQQARSAAQDEWIEADFEDIDPTEIKK